MKDETMPTAKHYGADGRALDEMSLPGRAFGTTPNEHVVWEAVRCYLANLRQGNASTKTLSFVQGSGRKPWRQKGTGRARAGLRRAPHWRGGAAVFGPRPRSYAYRLPKKVRRLALFSALSQRAREGKVGVFEGFDMKAPRTRVVTDFLKAAGISGNKVCFITRGSDAHLVRSVRNLPRVTVLPHSALNVYDLVNAELLVVSRDALEGIQEVFGA